MFDPELRQALTAALEGRYHLEDEVGRGGMATVFRATDLRHHRPVAIKVLAPAIARTWGPERFLREVRIAAQLQHPHIVPVFDSGAAGDLLWYAMPLIQGESLRQRLDREHQLPVPDVLAIAREVGGALAAAHAESVVHRDIKPENILLRDGHALVADFGIAKAAAGSEAGTGTLTETGFSLGTPAYMSPEQAAGERELDSRTDQYGLASVVYEMLTGEPPFTGPNPQAIIARRLSSPPRPVRPLRSAVSESMERALFRALERAPADRFPTVAAFVAALGEEAPTRGRPLPTWQRRVAAGLGVLGVGALLWNGLGSGRQHPKDAAIVDHPRIAILPLTTIGPDSSNDYLSEGLSEELLSALSQVSGLGVIARSAVARFQDSTLGPAELGRRLKVGSLVEGRIQRDGNRVRISLELIDTRTEERRWSQVYDEELTDVFKVQSSVARAVSEALQVRLVKGEAGRVGRRPTPNLEAYEHYLRGEYFQVRPTPRANLDSAIAHFRAAIALDRGFARAHAELASTYASQMFFYGEDAAAAREALIEVSTALALDSSLDAAYEARAQIAYTRAAGWRYLDAVRDLRSALQYNPNSLSARVAMGGTIHHFGLHDRALAELRTASSLDPGNEAALPRIGRTLWYMGRYKEAAAAFEVLPRPHWEYGVVLQHLGLTDSAFAYLGRLQARGGPDVVNGDVSSVLALVLASAGRRAEAMGWIDSTIKAAPEGQSHFHHAGYNVAAAYALLGEKSRALEWLKRTAEDGMPNFPLFSSDPNLQTLHGDPAFEAFMNQQRQLYDRLREALEGKQ